MWGESATMMEFKARVKRPVFLWARTNFFNKHFHRTSTKVPERLLGTIYFLHNLMAWSMEYALQTFYLGKVDFLSLTDVSPGITWIETKKIGNCKRVEKRKQRSDTTMWQKDSPKRRVNRGILLTSCNCSCSCYARLSYSVKIVQFVGSARNKWIIVENQWRNYLSVMVYKLNDPT